LIEALREITKLPAAPIDKPMALFMTSEDGKQITLRDFHRISWGAGAKELYSAFDDESVEDREFWIRAPENAVRTATIVAAFRGSATVDIEDWRWAEQVARHSINQLRRGLDKHGRDEMDQADLADRIRDYFRRKRRLTVGQVHKHCERQAKDYRDIDRVIEHLEKCSDIRRKRGSEGMSWLKTLKII
jgi:hypothetical protein